MSTSVAATTSTLEQQLQSALDSLYFVESVKLAMELVNAGAKLNIKDSQGRTPLHLAAEYDATELVALLITKGAAVDARDNKGRTPLMSTCSLSIVKLLIELGKADVNAVDNEGRTYLHSVAIHKRPGLIPLLVDKGALVDARDNWGETPLRRAIRTFQGTVPARLLIEAGANIRAVDNQDNNYLHDAVRCNVIALFPYFLNRGLPCNTPNKANQIPVQLTQDDSIRYFFHLWTSDPDIASLFSSAFVQGIVEKVTLEYMKAGYGLHNSISRDDAGYFFERKIVQDLLACELDKVWDGLYKQYEYKINEALNAFQADDKNESARAILNRVLYFYILECSLFLLSYEVYQQYNQQLDYICRNHVLGLETIDGRDVKDTKDNKESQDNQKGNQGDIKDKKEGKEQQERQVIQSYSVVEILGHGGISQSGIRRLIADMLIIPDLTTGVSNQVRMAGEKETRAELLQLYGVHFSKCIAQAQSRSTDKDATTTADKKDHKDGSTTTVSITTTSSTALQSSTPHYHATVAAAATTSASAAASSTTSAAASTTTTSAASAVTVVTNTKNSAATPTS